MIATDSNHCKIVRDSITGKRQVDNKTLTSLEVLKDRLERLKRCDSTFEPVKLSNYAKKLTTVKKAVAVG